MIVEATVTYAPNMVWLQIWTTVLITSGYCDGVIMPPCCWPPNFGVDVGSAIVDFTFFKATAHAIVPVGGEILVKRGSEFEIDRGNVAAKCNKQAQQAPQRMRQRIARAVCH